MQLYDSRTQKKITIPNDQVGMYCCGPTVYNDVHIGNVRPLITFDILYRYLLHSKIKTTYVHNITDVDDKIINKAQEVNVSESKISEEYTDHYTTVMKQLNALKMDELPKVTKNIDGIIKYVEKLVNLDKAYVSQEGDVYFSIDTVKDTYGEISKQNIEQLLDGVRKENKKDKRNLLDFVL
jgi:cysteinyl-tRNA synthetase